MRVNQTEPDHIKNGMEHFSSEINVTNTGYVTKRKRENQVISMSLYGSNPHYTRGAIENAKLVDKVFPGWKLRIFLSNASNLAVPLKIVDQLQSLDVSLVFINPSSTVIKPALWRFLVANDLTVDIFLVRDIDSRLLPRDATEVERWIQSGKGLSLHPRPFWSGWMAS